MPPCKIPPKGYRCGRRAWPGNIRTKAMLSFGRARWPTPASFWTSYSSPSVRNKRSASGSALPSRKNRCPWTSWRKVGKKRRASIAPRSWRCRRCTRRNRRRDWWERKSARRLTIRRNRFRHNSPFRHHPYVTARPRPIGGSSPKFFVRSTSFRPSRNPKTARLT